MTGRESTNLDFFLKKIVYSSNYYELDIEKRKKLIKNLKEAFKLNIKKIVDHNAKMVLIYKNETVYFEILPVIKSFDVILKKLNVWCINQLEDQYNFNNGRALNVYLPKGLVCLFIKVELMFFYLFTTLGSAIAAGNKVIIFLPHCELEKVLLIKSIIESVLLQSDVLILYQIDEINRTIADVDFDYYYAISDKETFDAFLPRVNKEKLSFLNTSDYLSVSLIDKKCDISQIFSDIFYSKYMYKGNLFFSNSVIFVHNDYLDNRIIKELIEQIENSVIKDNQNSICKFDSSDAFEPAFRHFKTLIDDKSNEVLYGGNADQDSLTIQPTIIKIDGDTSKIITPNKYPIIYLIPFNDVKQVNILIDNLPFINKLHIFCKDRDNMDFILKSVYAEIYLINDLYSYRLHPHLEFSESSMFYKGFGGYVNFSNLKSVLIKNRFFTLKKLFHRKFDSLRSKWWMHFMFK